MVSHWQFSVLNEILHFDKFKGASFKHNTSLPQIIFSKYPNKVCLIPNLGFLFRKKLNVFDKFEGANFKYETSYLQNNQLRHSFLPPFDPHFLYLLASSEQHSIMGFYPIFIIDSMQKCEHKVKGKIFSVWSKESFLFLS